MRFEHPFFDIDIERAEGEAAEMWLVKILSVSAHRFTYLVRGALDDNAVDYIKSLLDQAAFNDMVIERGTDGWQVSESRIRLKKHS